MAARPSDRPASAWLACGQHGRSIRPCTKWHVPLITRPTCPLAFLERPIDAEVAGEQYRRDTFLEVVRRGNDQVRIAGSRREDGRTICRAHGLSNRCRRSRPPRPVALPGRGRTIHNADGTVTGADSCGNLPLSASHGHRAVAEQFPPRGIDRGVAVHNHVAIGSPPSSSTECPQSHPPNHCRDTRTSPRRSGHAPTSRRFLRESLPCRRPAETDSEMLPSADRRAAGLCQSHLARR